MLKKLSLLIPALALVTAVGVAPAAGAIDCTTPQDCARKGVNQADTGSKQTDVGDIVQSVVNVLLFIIGAISVVMIVIGGIKYTVSNGDASQVKSAKDTIFYAIIGLVVAILAYAIVKWVISAFVAK